MIRALIPFFPLLTAAVALALGLLVVTRQPRRSAQWAFALGLLGMALLEVATYLVSRWPGPLTPLAIRVLAIGETLMILGWVLFGALFAEEHPLAKPQQWLRMAIVGGSLLAIVLLVMAEPFRLLATVEGKPLLVMTGPGRLSSTMALLAAVFALFQIEASFRATRGDVRRRATPFFLGLAGSVGFHTYVLSQGLLFAVIQPVILRVESAAFLLSLGLIGYGLIRHRLLEVKLSISRQVVYQSFTIAAMGSYLLGLGLTGEMMRRFGISLKFSLIILFIFSSALCLAFLLSSERARRRVRRFIDTHFYPSKYDYRQEWTEFTRKLTSVVGVEAILPRIVETLTETMGLPRVAILLSEEGGILRPVEAVGLRGAVPTIRTDSALGRMLREQKEPLILSGPRPANPLAEAAEPLRSLDLVGLVPLVAKGELVGLLAVGPAPDGKPFSYEDHDLLMTLAAQAATAILNARLAEQLARTRELEALHRVSSFALHDLKNLVATLSLITQNAAERGNDPAFQCDAFRAIKDSVKQMRELIARLSDLPKTLDLQLEPTDVNRLVRATVAEMKLVANGEITLVEELGSAPCVLADQEHLRKALYNLLLNAMEAITGTGEVRVRTTAHNGFVLLEVADTGPGIPEPLLTHGLFTPFKSTKRRGLGIGLYQVKTIVEGHGGHISVESRPGVGTTFQMDLPVRSSREGKATR